MPGYFGYRFALYAALILTADNLAFVIYANAYRPADVEAAKLYVAMAAALAFGLWVQSKFARYAGAVLLLIVFVFSAWSIMRAGRLVLSAGTVWALSVILLHLAIATTLLFSKTFASEFAHERERQPGYKRILRHVAIVLLIVLVGVGAYNDLSVLLAE